MTAQPARTLLNVSALSGDERAIAHSVLYASLFDYPLTLAQLRQTLIESAQTPSQIRAIYDQSDALQDAVEYRDGFFFPRGASDLVRTRRERETRSRAFLSRHRLLLMLIAAMPYVRMAALSGSIAHLNLDGDGDLDLFVVTRGRRVWSVTVALVVLAKVMGQRRIVCVNYVLADSRLALDQQDLFTASQIVHLKPLVGGDVFRQFVSANPFVARFYPNFYAAGASAFPFALPWLLASAKRVIEGLCALPSIALEAFCRRAYRSYLVRQAASWKSPEQVLLEDDALKLHTRSHRQSVMDRFESAVRDSFPRS